MFQGGIVNIRQCKTRQADFIMNLRFFVKLNCTLNETQGIVTLSVSIFLLIVLLRHEYWIENKGPSISDVHREGIGVLEIRNVFAVSTAF